MSCGACWGYRSKSLADRDFISRRDAEAQRWCAFFSEQILHYFGWANGLRRYGAFLLKVGLRYLAKVRSAASRPQGHVAAPQVPRAERWNSTEDETADAGSQYED